MKKIFSAFLVAGFLIVPAFSFASFGGVGVIQINYTFTTGGSEVIYDFGTDVFWVESANLFDCQPPITQVQISTLAIVLACDTGAPIHLRITGEILADTQGTGDGEVSIILAGYYVEQSSSAILTIALGTISSVLEYPRRLFTDLELLIIMAIGLPVGFWVINRVIGLAAKRVKDKREWRD